MKDRTLLAADFKPGQLPLPGISGGPNIVMNDICNSLSIDCLAGQESDRRRRRHGRRNHSG